LIGKPVQGLDFAVISFFDELQNEYLEPGSSSPKGQAQSRSRFAFSVSGDDVYITFLHFSPPGGVLLIIH